jgi:hypothetical protein
MAQYHFAGLALVLGIGGLLAAFTSGYFSGIFGATPTEWTEIILVVAVIAAFALMIGSVAAESRGGIRGTRGVAGLPGTSPRARRIASQRGTFNAGHVAWFTIAFILVVVVALGAGSWALVYQGADPVSAGVVGFLVFLLLMIVVAIIFGAMRVKDRFGKSSRK